jgi:hypothetical protein
MRKQKVHLYVDECWKQGFYFLIGWSDAAFARFMKRNFNHDIEGTHTTDGATYWLETEDGASTILIWTRNKAGALFYEVLAHECVHAAVRCLDTRGVKLDPSNDEPLAYLVSTLMRKALALLNKK